MEYTSDDYGLDLAHIVRNLLNASALESERTKDFRFCSGKHEAYDTLYHIIRATFKLDETEFERQIDERKAARTLQLEKDRIYEITYSKCKISIMGPIKDGESFINRSVRKNQDEPPTPGS